MTAIMRRELKAYFSSPIGYICIAAFYLFAGVFFFQYSLLSNSADITPVFGSMFTIILFLVPVLTMRLLSEERKNRTDQALLTAPVSLTGLVLGKFFASVVVFLLSLCVTFLQALIVAIYAPVEWPMVLGNFVALLLLGMALLSIGLFISSLTENQVIAAIGSFAIMLFIVMMSSFASVVKSPLLQKMITGLSFMGRFSEFMSGKFNLSGVVFFLSVCTVFVFLSVRVFEKRRWS